MIDKKTLNRKDAASFLGIAVSTLDKMAANGSIARVKLGRRVIYRIKDLETLLDANREFRR